VEVLADGFGGDDLHSKALRKSLGKLGGIPSAFLAKLAFHEGSGLLGDTWRIARSPPIEKTLEAPLFPAVEVATDARPAAPGVGREMACTLEPRWERRKTWGRADALWV
jgi:hypothetical protein